jgi:hypothetical protein
MPQQVRWPVFLWFCNKQPHWAKSSVVKKQREAAVSLCFLSVIGAFCYTENRRGFKVCKDIGHAFEC